MTVICDSGPIIALSKIALFDILQRLFGEIALPAEVFAEVASPGERRPGSREVAAPWVKRARVDLRLRREIERRERLGPGESAVLVLAGSVDDPLLVLDEVRARRCALRRGYRVVRSGALVVEAVRAGILPKGEGLRAVASLFTEARYIDEAIRDQLVRDLRSVG